MLNHAVCMNTFSGVAKRLGLQVGKDVHARGVEPAKERLFVFDRVADEFLRGCEKFFVNGWHAGDVQRTSVLDLLPSFTVRRGTDNTARAKFLFEGGILRIEISFRLLFSVQVIKIAEELIETVIGWQVV